MLNQIFISASGGGASFGAGAMVPTLQNNLGWKIFLMGKPVDFFFEPTLGYMLYLGGTTSFATSSGESASGTMNASSSITLGFSLGGAF